VVGFKRFAKVVDVIGAADKKDWPAIQVEELRQPVVLSDGVGASDLLFLPIIVPILIECTDSNIVLLSNIEHSSLLVGRVTMSVRDAFGKCDLLAQRLREVPLREGFSAHFLGNRSNFEIFADLLNQTLKVELCSRVCLRGDPWSCKRLVWVFIHEGFQGSRKFVEWAQSTVIIHPIQHGVAV
jgi:hypothetical protein